MDPDAQSAVGVGLNSAAIVGAFVAIFIGAFQGDFSAIGVSAATVAILFGFYNLNNLSEPGENHAAE